MAVRGLNAAGQGGDGKGSQRGPRPGYLLALGGTPYPRTAGPSLLPGLPAGAMGRPTGAFLDLNFMLAGTTSTNPILYTATILLFGGAASGYIGVDRYLLPWLKETWSRRRAPSRLT